RRRAKPLKDGKTPHTTEGKYEDKLIANHSRKLKRPFDKKRPISLTMKATKAKGRLSMGSHKNRAVVDRLLEKSVKRTKAKVHRFANVGNHLHLLVSFPSRDALKRFLRTFSGEVARAITGARRGKPFGKFWDALAHSRVIIGRKAYLAIDRYIFANQLEAGHGYKNREFFRKNMKSSFKVDVEDIPEEYRQRS
ncbi:MAG: transposase, partial [Bdellovibrionota bacterium]